MTTYSFAGEDSCGQGESFVRRLEFKSDAGVGLDLTNLTFAMQVRKTPTSAVVLDFKESDSSIVKSIPGFYIDLLKTPAETRAIEACEYVYDLEMTDTVTGYVLRVLSGKFVVTPEVTR